MAESNQNSLFTNLRRIIKENLKVIIYLISFIFIIFVFIQLYFYYDNNRILQTSIKYNNAKLIESDSEFIAQMTDLAKKNNFYGLMAQLEIINKKLRNNNFNSAYDDYILLLNNNNEPIYQTIVAIHGAYNLLDKIDNSEIFNLLLFIDNSLISFEGNKLEIQYLLYLSENKIDEKNNLYEQIMNSDQISSSIKERIRIINDFEKYK